MERYREYKDSGVQWLGEIPSHWEIVPFKRIIKNRKVGSWGAEPKEKGVNCVCLRIADFDYSKLRFKRVSNYTIRSYSSNDLVDRMLETGDILIEKSGGGEKTPVGRAVLYDLDISNAMYANFMEKIKLKSLLSPFFCIYYLSALYSCREIWKYVKFTTGIQNIDMAAFIRNEKIVFPPKEEQHAIVSYLDTKCSRIEILLSNKEKEISLLQEMKQRVIADAVTRGLNPNVKFKSTNIPWLTEIPEHWEIMRAKNLFQKEQRPVQEGDEIVTCFRDGEVTLRKNRRTSGFTEATDYSHYQHICKGDLVIHQMDAFAGSSGVSDSDGMGTPVLSVCTPKIDRIDNYYYAHILRLMGKNGFILSLYRGIRERSSDFRFDTFVKQWLPVPSLSEQHAIVSYITERTAKIDSLIEKLNKEIECVKEYKQRLISDVVTGQIKV